MAKGFYHYIGKAWKHPRELELWRSRLIEWRRTESIVKVDKPLRLDKARMLGYKAKLGFVVVRVRVSRGGRTRTRPAKKARRSKRQTIRKVLSMNHQWVAEQRAARKHKNLEVLNSYWIAKDGRYAWYEVILVDPKNASIKSDKDVGWIAMQRGRVFRGLTSAGKKSRGLLHKGKGAEKIRPSRRAAARRVWRIGR